MTTTKPQNPNATPEPTPARKTLLPAQKLINQARDICDGKAPLPTPETADLASLLDAACAAQVACADAQSARDVAIEAEATTGNALEADLASAHPGLSEEKAMVKIRASRDRADAARLRKRRAESLLTSARTAQHKALLDFVRAALSAAEAQTVRLIHGEIVRTEALLDPDYLSRNGSECREIVNNLVLRMADVCRIGSEWSWIRGHIGEVITTNEINPQTARAIVANAARVVAYFQAQAKPSRGSQKSLG